MIFALWVSQGRWCGNSNIPLLIFQTTKQDLASRCAQELSILLHILRWRMIQHDNQRTDYTVILITLILGLTISEIELEMCSWECTLQGCQSNVSVIYTNVQHLFWLNILKKKMERKSSAVAHRNCSHSFQLNVTNPLFTYS